MLWFTSTLRFRPNYFANDRTNRILAQLEFPLPAIVAMDGAESTGEFLATCQGAPYWLN